MDNKKMHLTFESENLALPEVKTNETEEENTSGVENNEISYENLAMPEIHFNSRKNSDSSIQKGSTVMVTGTGRSYALGYNLVLRYLENGDTVIATVRKHSPELETLRAKYGSRLHILTMDIGNTASVKKAAEKAKKLVPHIDILINNAVSVSEDCDREFFDINPDNIVSTVNITAVGALRVIQSFYPLLVNGDRMSVIYNISSEAGSISKCYRTNLIEYGMAKAALNMGTMNLVNTFKDNDKINIYCIHPGWIRTDGKPDNQAPLSSYDAAEILRKLFDEKRFDKTGPRFITNEGTEYPF